MIDAEKIFIGYMKSPIEEIDNYIKKVCKEYNTTESYIKERIMIQAKNHSYYERQLLLQKKERSRAIKKKYVQKIMLYLNDKEENLYLLLSLGPKMTILESLDNYLKIFNENEKEIKEIKNNLDIILEDSKKDIQLCNQLTNYLITSDDYKNREYIQFFSKLISVTKEEAINHIEQSNISSTLYSKYLKLFQRNYPTLTNLFNYLRELYVSYVYNTENNNIFDTYLTRPIIALKEINKLLKTNYGIEEYCSIYGYPISKYKNYLKEIEKYNKEEYVEIIEQLEKRKENDETMCFERDIKLLVYKIASTKKFDLLDYYLNTSLSIRDFIKVCSHIVYDKKVIGKLIERLHQIGNIGYKKHFSRTLELNTTTIRNNVVLKNSEKEKIFAFMDEYHIPDEVYFTCVDRFMDGTLEIDKIKKLKK